MITFIYTKCPLPTFCPLMDRHFAAMQKPLKADPALNKVHLVTVSFDPATDTPPVLKEHAKKLEADLDALDVPDRRSRRHRSVRGTLRRLGRRARMNDPRDITHNLRTAIVDADGKLVKVYTGNEWTPEQVLADLKPARASTEVGIQSTSAVRTLRDPAFSPRERRLIARLRTPLAVQRYLNRLPYNQEPGGRATLRSFRGVVRHGCAHCLEAALFAAVVLEQHGYPPLVLSFESIDQLDHVIFVYRQRREDGDRSPGRAIRACTDASRSSRRRARWRSATSIRTSTSPDASPDTRS